ncbi:hypothetical protein SERLA73DRAFT_70449 [Serpula lacrymans var. lacrymans S7.3]|uniref:Reverse transcriptase RNase H-like domain-containing protein n=2 Tax=Serpula lacrymans var. lacrymans TaxID=341189 RepID=F8PMZ0_SERL3|nr:uncharacterized protein SERLADRAFT_434570 [Serpula lacrymans var. lacrymans S7.9]EGO02972.1 hypothetical protein SERLA73DRAFT_70449 [Serpula lacrymans var. lacrymans S7.3]EGO28655.1 hypothetical protein SERLADRAFT_434570 [Serpula lacrymans var. lacrymans S7.9]
MEHVKGNQNTKADLLSRRINHPKGTNDNENQTLLPDVHFEVLDTNKGYLPDICRSFQKQDDIVKKNLKEKSDTWKVKDRIIWIKRESATSSYPIPLADRVYVP